MTRDVHHFNRAFKNFLLLVVRSGQLAMPGLSDRNLLKISTLLLETGASPNIRDKFGFHSLHSLIDHGGISGSNLEAEFMSLLLQYKVDVNMQDFTGCTPLHYAVKEPRVTNAWKLLLSGALVDAQDYRGMTPLVHMFNSNNTEMIKRLVLQGNASVNMQDNDGRTTLSRAVEVGNEPVVQLLLQESGTRVNLEDRNGATPLHLAAAYEHLQLAEMLIRASADLNARDFCNATPLHYVAYAGTPEIVSVLLEVGADPKLTDTDGRLPVHYARSRHNYHTALKFGHALGHTSITPCTATDDTV